MAKVSNETKLVIALLKEKAKSKKEWSVGAREDREDKFRDGIDWALQTLDEIVAGIAKP